MGKEKIRLSKVFGEFVASVIAEGKEVAAAVVETVTAGITLDESRAGRVVDGRRVPIHVVDLAGLPLAAPNIKHESRELTRAIADEVKLRGNDWGDECLAGAVTEHVVKPLTAFTLMGGADAAEVKPAKSKGRR